MGLVQVDMRDISLVAIAREQRLKVRSVIFCLLFILATDLAHYSECAQAGHHLDLAAEHEASSSKMRETWHFSTYFRGGVKVSHLQIRKF